MTSISLTSVEFKDVAKIIFQSNSNFESDLVIFENARTIHFPLEPPNRNEKGLEKVDIESSTCLMNRLCVIERRNSSVCPQSSEDTTSSITEYSTTTNSAATFVNPKHSFYWIFCAAILHVLLVFQENNVN